MSVIQGLWNIPQMKVVKAEFLFCIGKFFEDRCGKDFPHGRIHSVGDPPYNRFPVAVSYHKDSNRRLWIAIMKGKRSVFVLNLWITILTLVKGCGMYPRYLLELVSSFLYGYCLLWRVHICVCRFATYFLQPFYRDVLGHDVKNRTYIQLRATKASYSKLCLHNWGLNLYIWFFNPRKIDSPISIVKHVTFGLQIRSLYTDIPLLNILCDTEHATPIKT